MWDCGATWTPLLIVALSFVLFVTEPGRAVAMDTMVRQEAELGEAGFSLVLVKAMVVQLEAKLTTSMAAMVAMAQDEVTGVADQNPLVTSSHMGVVATRAGWRTARAVAVLAELLVILMHHLQPKGR